MNKYQQALDNYSENVDYRDYSTKTVDIVNESYDTLQELVDQTKTPTLEEVKKEWEKLGYEFTTYTAEEYTMRKFEISKYGEKIILWYDHSYSKVGNTDHCFTLQEHQLLTKTFRALGWFDE